MPYHLATDKPRDAMKHTTLIFYGENSSAQAKELAVAEREAHRHGFTRDAASFLGEREEADMVVVMPDVKNHHRKRVEQTYPDKIKPIEALADASTLVAKPEPVTVVGLPSFDGAWPVGSEFKNEGEPATAEDLSVDPGPEAATFQIPKETLEKLFREPNMKRHAELNVMPFAQLQKLARELKIKNPHQIKKTFLIEQILELE